MNKEDVKRKIKRKVLFLTIKYVVPAMCVVFLIIVVAMALSSFLGDDKKEKRESVGICKDVEVYRPDVYKEAKSRGLEDFMDIIMCVMEVETGGQGEDLFNVWQKGLVKNNQKVTTTLSIQLFLDYFKKLVQVNDLSKEDIKLDVLNKRHEMIDFGMQFIGIPYDLGGKTFQAKEGIDCSGFTYQLYKHVGIEIPGYSWGQYEASVKINYSQLMPGDLVFYDHSPPYGKVDHVAMYIGDGKILHSSGYTDGIGISNYNYVTPYGYGRFIDDMIYGITYGDNEDELKLFFQCINYGEGYYEYYKNFGSNREGAEKKYLKEVLSKTSDGTNGYDASYAGSVMFLYQRTYVDNKVKDSMVYPLKDYRKIIVNNKNFYESIDYDEYKNYTTYLGGSMYYQNQEDEIVYACMTGKLYYPADTTREFICIESENDYFLGDYVAEYAKIDTDGYDIEDGAWVEKGTPIGRTCSVVTAGAMEGGAWFSKHEINTYIKFRMYSKKNNATASIFDFFGYDFEVVDWPEEGMVNN